MPGRVGETLPTQSAEKWPRGNSDLTWFARRTQENKWISTFMMATKSRVSQYVAPGCIVHPIPKRWVVFCVLDAVFDCFSLFFHHFFAILA